MSTKNKTTPNDTSVEDFLSQTVSDPQKRADCMQLIKIMGAISGKKARMWGASIVGFDAYHYIYDSGREGDTCILGFSPRKANLTIYFVDGFDPYKSELKKLGKFKNSKSCLYVKSLSDIDIALLTSMLSASYQRVTSRYPQ